MQLNSDFYIDVKKISIAHEFVLDTKHICEYPLGRGQYGLIYTINGEADYRFVAGERLTAKAGDLLFLSAKAAYRIEPKGEFKHYTVNFSVNEESSALNFFNRDYFLISSQNRELYRHIFKELTAIWNSKKIGYEMRATALVYELLSLVLSDLHSERYNTTAYHRLQPAKQYIDINFEKEFKVEFLAKLTDMSTTNFRREWVKLFGETSLQYRDRVRISTAKEYLSSGYYTVSEVAERCGFEDVSYFVRFLKKHTGISPGTFKNTFVNR